MGKDGEMHAAAQLFKLEDMKRIASEDPSSVCQAGHMMRTPMMCAARWGQVQAIEFLHSKGAPVNQTDIAGRTALVWSIQYGRKDAVAALLRLGAVVNVIDMNHSTPLHYAVAYLQPEVLQMLLKQGAMPLTKDKTGFTPRDLLAQRQSGTPAAQTIADLLLQAESSFAPKKTRSILTPTGLASPATSTTSTMESSDSTSTGYFESPRNSNSNLNTMMLGGGTGGAHLQCQHHDTASVSSLGSTTSSPALFSYQEQQQQHYDQLSESLGVGIKEEDMMMIMTGYDEISSNNSVASTTSSSGSTIAGPSYEKGKGWGGNKRSSSSWNEGPAACGGCGRDSCSHCQRRSSSNNNPMMMMRTTTVPEGSTPAASVSSSMYHMQPHHQQRQQQQQVGGGGGGGGGGRGDPFVANKRRVMEGGNRDTSNFGFGSTTAGGKAAIDPTSLPSSTPFSIPCSSGALIGITEDMELSMPGGAGMFDNSFLEMEGGGDGTDLWELPDLAQVWGDAK